MKKILVIACFFLFLFNQVLAIVPPCNNLTLLCEDTTITYDPLECSIYNPSTLTRWYRINVSSAMSFSSSWTSNCNMITFKVYGPYNINNDVRSICNDITNNNANVYYSAGGSNVTNIDFSSNPPNHVQVGSYIIMITYDICPTTLDVTLTGVRCEPSTRTLPSLPFPYTPVLPDTSLSDPPCDTCMTFKPIVGNDYWLSAWVKEDHTSQVKSYLDSYVELTFTSSGVSPLSMFTTGEIIDGWQRIVGKFTVPIGTTDIHIDLVNNSGVDAYFDDVRIHPFNGSMKSYVYDPETLWLNAELDDNNYATVYEYDKEGGLVRIKKETSRGMVTIQETRSNTQKQH